MSESSEDLIKKKKDVLFPYLPFISRMLQRVEGTGLAARWRTMHECITNDRKRMSLEQIYKMENTLCGLQNDLKHKKEESNNRPKNSYGGPHTSEQSFSRQSMDFNKRRQPDGGFRNHSPAHFSGSNHHRESFSSHRNEDRRQHFSQNRRSFFNEETQQRHTDNMGRVTPPNRPFDHASRRQYHHNNDPRNFNQSGHFNTKTNHRAYDHSRPYPRSQSRPHDHPTWGGSARFKPYERSQSRPFEETHARSFEKTQSRPHEKTVAKSKNSSVPKTKEEKKIEENVMWTHPKFADPPLNSEKSLEKKDIPAPTPASVDQSSQEDDKEKFTEEINVKLQKVESVLASEKPEEKQNECISQAAENNQENIFTQEEESTKSEQHPLTDCQESTQKNDDLTENPLEIEPTISAIEHDINGDDKMDVDNQNVAENMSEIDQKTLKTEQQPVDDIKMETEHHELKTFKIEEQTESCAKIEKEDEQNVAAISDATVDDIDLLNDSVKSEQQSEQCAKIKQEKEEKLAVLSDAKVDVDILKDSVKSENKQQPEMDSTSDPSDLEEEPENIEELWAKISQMSATVGEQETQEPNKQVEKIQEPAITNEPDESLEIQMKPTSAKKPRKKKSELEKLQDDLNRTIDRDSIIKSSIKPRSCTMQKPTCEKTKPCSVRLIRLNLTSRDMPVKVDGNFMIKPLHAAKKSKKSKTLTVIPESSAAITVNIKPEPEPSAPIVFKQTLTQPPPIKKEQDELPKKRKSSAEFGEKSHSKKQKICTEDEWVDVAAKKKQPTPRNKIALRTFKKLFDQHTADYDKKHPEIIQMRKFCKKTKKNKKKNITKNNVDESEVCSNTPAITEEPKTIKVQEEEPPAVVSPAASSSKTFPLVVRRIVRQEPSALKIVAVKPLPRVSAEVSSPAPLPTASPPAIVKSTRVLIVSPTKHAQVATAQPRTMKPLPTTSNLRLRTSAPAPLKVVGRIVPAPSASALPTTVGVSSSIKITNVASEQSSRVNRIPITLPCATTEQQQPIEVIDISDDEDEDVVAVDVLRPWIEQSKYKSKKNEKACRAMINNHCLAALYKCMGSTCCFYTSEKNHFQVHLELHRDHQKEDAPNYLLCSYCEHRASDIAALIAHVNNTHGSSTFSCSCCFFRSLNEFQVTVNHYQKHHQNEKKEIISFHPTVKREKNYDLKYVRQSISQFCQPLTCIFCPKAFYIISSFVEHIQNHKEKNLTKCIKCGETEDSANILVHFFNCYGFGLFQCVYCSFGTSTINFIDDHLTSRHPDRATYFASRNLNESGGERKNPLHVSSLSLKEINKEPSEEVQFVKILMLNCEPMRNSKNLGNLSDEPVDNSEEEEEEVLEEGTSEVRSTSVTSPSTCPLMIQNVSSLTTN